MAECIPYTYLIGWSAIDKWYYGVQYGIGCTPDNLWKTYFTSSKLVQKTRKLYGEPNVIQVRKVFVNPDMALLWEQKVLKKLKIKTNEKWLNIAIGNPSFKGYLHTEKTKEKMRKPKPAGFGVKVSNFHSGKRRSPQARLNISLSKKGTDFRSKVWLFEFDGKIVQIRNLAKYCRENNLNISCMKDVYYGKQNKHKNFKRIP